MTQLCSLSTIRDGHKPISSQNSTKKMQKEKPNLLLFQREWKSWLAYLMAASISKILH